MRWSSRLLALAVTGALGASAFDASLFTFHQDGQDSVSEDVAQLILELRTKSSLAAVLGKMETGTADQLNQFVRSDGMLFGGADGHDAPMRSLVLLEGIDGQVGMLFGPWEFWVTTYPPNRIGSSKEPTKLYPHPSCFLRFHGQ